MFVWISLWALLHLLQLWNWQLLTMFAKNLLSNELLLVESELADAVAQLSIAQS